MPCMRKQQRLLPGSSDPCRMRLTLDPRALGGSATDRSRALWHLSHTACVSFASEPIGSGSAPHVWPVAPVRRSYYGRG
jgi:hypothetical protein